jgi:glycosyltransferase involved in cell wall biosynthesis
MHSSNNVGGRAALRIGIDCHQSSGIFQGSRTHILELFSRVIAACPDFQFLLFADEPQVLRAFSESFSLSNATLLKIRRLDPVRRLCWQLPRLRWQHGLDILHTQYISPPVFHGHAVVTIHDLLFESHPQFFTPLFRLRSRLLFRRSAKQAAHVFTVSEFSKSEIMGRYGVASEKISVIHNGVDRSRFYPGKSAIEVIYKYGLNSGGFILSVGRLEPRKNYLTLLRAYARLNTPKPPLVIIGQCDFRFDAIFREIQRLRLGGTVRCLQDVGDADLPAFYRHASLFVYPSWAEGFGMPVLEALASGTPVITSDTTSIPEVVGTAGILVEPSDIETLSSSMAMLLNSSDLCDRMRRSGVIQAAKFEWEKAAMRVRYVYENVGCPVQLQAV